MKTITRKLALYISLNGAYYVFEPHDGDENDPHFTLASEIIEIEFTMLPEQAAQARIDAIEARKRELQGEIDRLELMSVSHE
ncbi:MAG: hypothetical protein ACXWT4_06145 [Methylobacter sp.]